MSDGLTGIVRVLHIISAASWLGGNFLWSMVIAPRVLARGPPAIRRPVLEAALPSITNFFRIAAGTALVTGFVLVGQIWGWDNYSSAFQAPGGYGTALGIGTVAAVAMAIVGFGIVSPTGHKMLATMQGINGPPTEAQQAQLAALGKKIGMMSMVTVLFGTIAIVGMAWAVNAVR